MNDFAGSLARNPIPVKFEEPLKFTHCESLLLPGVRSPACRRAQEAAPVSGVFPADGPLHLLEIRIQAV